MDVLVIGGSVFLGRAVVDEAVAAGHRVTVFNRGLSARAPAGVEQVRGDRTVTADLARLAGRRFDLVVDTCGYVPAEVALSADLLRDSADHYAFVSTVSVYRGWPADPDPAAAGVFDGLPDATRETVPASVEPGQDYGWLKVGCERAVERAFGPGRCSLLRAGLIVGPDDSAVGRLPWWTDRFARGGEVLVPGAPADPIALIDARDLARFALTRAAGTLTCVGSGAHATWGDLVDALAADSTDARVTWVDTAWLAAQQLQPWTEMPLWLGAQDAEGAWNHDDSAAVSAGLRCRPLADTVRDTRAWQQALDLPWQPTDRTPGLTPAREAELLAAWRAR